MGEYYAFMKSGKVEWEKLYLIHEKTGQKGKDISIFDLTPERQTSSDFNGRYGLK